MAEKKPASEHTHPLAEHTHPAVEHSHPHEHPERFHTHEAMVAAIRGLLLAFEVGPHNSAQMEALERVREVVGEA